MFLNACIALVVALFCVDVLRSYPRLTLLSRLIICAVATLLASAIAHLGFHL